MAAGADRVDVLYGVRLEYIAKWGDPTAMRVSWRLQGRRVKCKAENLTEASARALSAVIKCHIRDYEPLEGRQVVAWSEERMSEPCGI